MKYSRNWSEKRISERHSPVCVCVCVCQLAQLRSAGTRKAVISFGAGSGRQWIWGKFSKQMCHWLSTLSDFCTWNSGHLGSQVLKAFRIQRIKKKKSTNPKTRTNLVLTLHTSSSQFGSLFENMVEAMEASSRKNTVCLGF